MKRAIVLLLSFFMFNQVSLLKAGDFESNLKLILAQPQAKEYLSGYVQPFATALGTGLGGALFHRGYSKSVPRFDVGVSAVYVPIPDEGKTFTFMQMSKPTVFGTDKPADPAAIPGLNQDKFLLPMLHANIGLFGGFEGTVRFVKANLGDFWDLMLWGGGIKYELSDLILIPMFPIDFGLQAAYPLRDKTAGGEANFLTAADDLRKLVSQVLSHRYPE